MTYLVVDDEGFNLYCPHCHVLIEEVRIHRAYEAEVTCFECLEVSRITIEIERS